MNKIYRCLFVFLFFACTLQSVAQRSKLVINDSNYFETRGLNILAFSNNYGLFGDEKMSGIGIIHHGVRTATSGDVRLYPTPEQWDSIPQFIRRDVNKQTNTIEAFLRYISYDFNYSVKITAKDDGVLISVHLDKELPAALVGHAGFNLEFLPAAYFRKSYMADNKTGIFPLYPSGPMEAADPSPRPPLLKSSNANPYDATPIATAKKFVLAPEDPERRITIISNDGQLSLYDGRNKAQNGWFVMRGLLPSGKTGKVLEWFISGNTIPNWVRKPMIAYSQAGYHPDQAKKAVIELDKNDKPLTTARLLKVNENGQLAEKLKGSLTKWGNYLRYQYYTFDFSSVKEDGLYVIEYGSERTKPLRIGKEVFADVWYPTLDVFFPVQMDHHRETVVRHCL